MEILSIKFAILVVQLAFCIVPIALGIRICTLSSDIKEETRQKISKKLLGDPTLFEPRFYNFALHFTAFAFFILGLIISLYVIFIAL